MAVLVESQEDVIENIESNTLEALHQTTAAMSSLDKIRFEMLRGASLKKNRKVVIFASILLVAAIWHWLDLLAQ